MAFVGLFSLFIMFKVTGEGRLAFTHSQLSAVLHVLMPLVFGLCILAMVISLPRFPSLDSSSHVLLPIFIPKHACAIRSG
jgi:hypothetical protein